MSSFIPPIADQRFVLEHVVGLDALDGDIVDAVLEGAGQIAADQWAPLRIAGDREGARWTPEGVQTPTGFAAAYRDFVSGGWGTIGVAEEFGGQGLPFALQVAVIDTLGCANTTLALCPILSSGAVEAISHHGSAMQKATWLPKLVTGEWTGTMNLTEPQAGSDVGALKTRATPRGDGTWSIKGTKIFISFGDHDMAENIVHLVLARTPGAPEGTKGISLFLVPKYRLNGDGTPGAFNDARAISIEHKLGLHGSPTCVMSFGEEDDCIGELIGPEHGGMRAMFTMMNNARLFVGLQGVHAAEGATQAAVAYAKQRIQSARAGSADRSPVAIIEHPDVRRMLLRMRAQTDAARALVYYTAGQGDRAHGGDAAAVSRVALLTPLAKAHATDIGCEVASIGIQVHGGMGFIEETGVAQFFRDSRIFPIYEGTNGIQAADLVGRKLGLDGGAAFAGLLADMEGEAEHDALCALIARCRTIGERMAQADALDRLAGSTPFLTMLSVAVCGWLVERQARIVSDSDGTDFAARKRASARFYLDQIVPEAEGLAAAASAPAEAFYMLSTDAFA
ncbi:acyl-CoA dehydrogenase [Sphingobium sp. AP49]|uniref:acyl-CoA dehydrogenase n=1 Tax=Sphingobium sp. AP49 TaxID=1144307 RepID=UPI00026EDCD7|nr:acyl-CoA dehydrogenase [Sphingobium sp. AP49]WHO39121.1 acyl-CoA dehydrogenase [Sphingobium sp. AP49]